MGSDDFRKSGGLVNGKRQTTRSAAKRAAQPTVDHREPWPEQAASFVEFFVFLLVLKSFFLPLFIIPTGSMAATLYGEHAINTCPNCGMEYAVGWQKPANWPQGRRFHPVSVQCPNCRWQQYFDFGHPHALRAKGLAQSEILSNPLRSSPGDRIFVHGWNYAPILDGIGDVGPQRWDVVVFKVPRDGQTNYIKRLLGLPGEQLEFINGDLFVNDQIARKTADAQRSLWFPYYNHDYPPQEPSLRAGYHPRWVALDSDSQWAGLHSRVPRFDGTDAPRGEIQFATQPGDPTREPGRIEDTYAYNGIWKTPKQVTDVCLSAELCIEDGDGYVELSTTKYDDRFFARLSGDGHLTLERQRLGQAAPNEPELLGQAQIAKAGTPVKIALSNVDYQVSVMVNGEAAIVSTPEQYAITVAEARRLVDRVSTPQIRVACERVRATVRHLAIERDVYYTADPDRGSNRPANAGTGHPLTLKPTEYFCCGDNSPNSLDGRYWYEDTLGPHLQADCRAEAYTVGTVPADQLIGHAFFVYWPGFMPLTSGGPNLLPDLGRARWIR